MGDNVDKLVSTEWLAEELGAEDLRVFDATVFLGRNDDGTPTIESGRGAFDKAHIPGSGFIDIISEISDTASSLTFTAPSPDQLAATLADRGVGTGTRVVFYDRTMNMWATRAWWLLRSIGFDSAAVLDGGWKAWTTDGREVSTEQAPAHPRGDLLAADNSAVFVGSDAVRQATDDNSVCIINSLSADQHSGADLSYGQPGHIESAVNVPAMGLVDPTTHRYRPLDELANDFDGVGATGSRVITYCGGGIAATSDAFILTLLGHEDVAVYDGSLRDWVGQGLPLVV